ncbi:divalent-cation tolerance protein CutA [Phenylobacterium sp.]|jgi:periplasmic divalent cation tolerance protein|uniref:divalent-cation tolerance protein CutA n=1 Tax=Phenylobacterium sp. TaxID=1871053 RepID=UPI002ED7ECBA
MKMIVVQTTTANAADAERLAEALVTERLAACVQIDPIRSLYVWKGQVERQEERRLSIKTRADLFEAVRARLRDLHSYDTPEVIALPVEAADPDYLAWLAETTGAR